MMVKNRLCEFEVGIDSEAEKPVLIVLLLLQLAL